MLITLLITTNNYFHTIGFHLFIKKYTHRQFLLFMITTYVTIQLVFIGFRKKTRCVVEGTFIETIAISTLQY